MPPAATTRGLTSGTAFFQARIPSVHRRPAKMGEELFNNGMFNLARNNSALKRPKLYPQNVSAMGKYTSYENEGSAPDDGMDSSWHCNYMIKRAHPHLEVPTAPLTPAAKRARATAITRMLAAKAHAARAAASSRGMQGVNNGAQSQGEIKRYMDECAERGEEPETGEHLGDLKPVSRLDNAPGESRGGARSGHELRHHRADQAQPARNLQPGHEIGQGLWQTQMDQHLPA